MYRNLDEKHKEESLKTDNGRGSWTKDVKDREEKRKFEKSRDDGSSEGKRGIVNDSKDDFSDVRHKEGMHGEIKEKDNRMSENRHKENRTKEGRYKDEKEKELKVKTGALGFSPASSIALVFNYWKGMIFVLSK